MTRKGIDRRTFLRGSAGLAAGLVLTACGTPPSSPPTVAPDAGGATGTQSPGTSAGSRPFAGKKITIATSDGQRQEALNLLAAAFTEQTGATFEVSAFPQGEFRAKITADLASGTGLYDVLIEPYVFLHDHKKADLLLPIDQYTAKDATLNIQDFSPAVLDAYGRFGGDTLYALPFQIDTQLLFYRKDLFEDEAVQASFKAQTGKDLIVPRTHAELVETARFFTKSLNPDSPIEYGWATWGEKIGSFWWWAIRLASYGGSYLDANFRPNFNNDAGRQAVEICEQLLAASPPDIGQYDWDKMNTAFLRGDVALMEQWNGFATLAEQPDGASGQSQVVGKVGYAVPPGAEQNGQIAHASLLGGWAMAVAKQTKEPDLAYATLAFLSSKEAELARLPTGSPPTRISVLNDPTILADNPSYAAMAEALAVAKIGADVDAAPVSSQLQEVLRTALNRVWIGEIPGTQALQETDAEWTQILQEAGLYK